MVPPANQGRWSFAKALRRAERPRQFGERFALPLVAQVLGDFDRGGERRGSRGRKRRDEVGHVGARMFRHAVDNEDPARAVPHSDRGRNDPGGLAVGGTPRPPAPHNLLDRSSRR